MKPWGRRRERPFQADPEALDDLQRLSKEARRLAQELTAVAIRLRIETEEQARERE